ncbi:MAG TPA: copper resistance CopC family protein [Longimicrobiales bacterium]|nr:copper resistance CopC family protein [Longimicrobiales bacterium]
MKAKHSLLALCLLLVAGALGAAGAHAALHFELSGSLPEPDATVPPPEEVRLWFTEAPQEGSVAIRLIDPAGEPVETGEPTPAEDDARVVSVAVEPRLAPGRYTVSWRGIGDDGHVVRGDFGFTVAAAE